jgi:hypothetical protein
VDALLLFGPVLGLFVSCDFLTPLIIISFFLCLKRIILKLQLFTYIFYSHNYKSITQAYKCPLDEQFKKHGHLSFTIGQ